MKASFKFRCISCGIIFTTASEVTEHLVNNINHVIIEQYSSDDADGISESLVLKSPNGSKWKLKIDDNGNLTTERIT